MRGIFNPLDKDIETYNRFNFDFHESYIKQATAYVQRIEGVSMDAAKARVLSAISTQDLKDPVVSFFRRDRETLDRKRVAAPMSKYLTSIYKESGILVPSMTTYVSKDVEISKHAELVEIKTKNRGKLKSKAFAAKVKNDMVGFTINNIGQTNEKLDTNSISGIYITLGSILYNPSNHSTLTSNTRIVTSIANAMFERLISGNRNYQTKNIALNDLLAITLAVDKDKVNAVLSKYNLCIPSKKQVYGSVMESMRHYVVNDDGVAIKRFINTMSPEERLMYIYHGDLSALFLHNSELFKPLIKTILETETQTYDNALERVKGLNDFDISMVSNILYTDLKGKGKDYDNFEPALLNKIASVAESLEKMMRYLKLLFDTFFLVDFIPAGVPYIRDMARKSVIMSDTDSTTPCIQELVHWYKGDYKVDDTAYGIAGIVMFFGERYLEHLLKIYSVNTGVSPKDISKIAMKSEFSFNAMVTLNISKHYFSLISMQEGNVYTDFDTEIKGVNLKNSALPMRITAKAKAMMKKILLQANDGELIDPHQYIQEVIDIEKMVKKAILDNDSELLKRITIKDSDSYSNKDPYKSNYRYLMRWNDIFSEHYDYTADVPASMVKLSTTLVNKTTFNAWLDSLEEPIRSKAMTHFKREGITLMKKVYIPEDYLSSNPAPPEIARIIDYDEMVRDLCNIFYIILSGLAIYKSKKFTFEQWVKELP